MTDSSNLLTAFDLQGFDMVVAITQETINYQLKQLWKKGVIHRTLKIEHEQDDPDDPYSKPAKITLTANLGPPTVAIIKGADNRRKLLFHLKMTSGALTSSYLRTVGAKFTSNFVTLFTISLVNGNTPAIFKFSQVVGLVMSETMAFLLSQEYNIQVPPFTQEVILADLL